VYLKDIQAFDSEALSKVASVSALLLFTSSSPVEDGEKVTINAVLLGATILCHGVCFLASPSPSTRHSAYGSCRWTTTLNVTCHCSVMQSFDSKKHSKDSVLRDETNTCSRDYWPTLKWTLYISKRSPMLRFAQTG
jgi:hypothetical protein